MKIIQLAMILIFVSGCATVYKNEDQHYLGIKSILARDQYSLAVVEIIEFENKYPKSEKLCELLPIHIAWRKDRGYSTEEIEKRYKEKCK